MPSPNRPRRLVAALIALVTMVGLVLAASAQTGPPPTEIQATQVPPTDPPPTAVPTDPPTAIPTDVPPTDIPTAIPTDVPTVIPTEEPTEVPTEEPTSTPGPFPTETPGTPRPAPTNPPSPPQRPQPTSPPVAREADVTCAPPGATDATPGGTPLAATPTPAIVDGWLLQVCFLRLEAVLLDEIEIRGKTTTPGWEVILVEEDAVDTPGLLDASNNLVTIRPEEGEREVTFLLGVRRSCTAFPAAPIELEIAGRAGADQAATTATATLTLELPPPPPPTVELVSVRVDTEREPAPTTIRLRYGDAPVACGWQVVVSLVDPGDAAWELVTVDGPEGLTAAMADGTISILLPPAGAAAGEIAIMLVAPGIPDAVIGPLQAEAFPWP